MKVEKEQLDSTRWLLTVEVPFEESQDKIEAELEKMQKDAQIDGFRKGKVPMSLIRKRYAKMLQMEVIHDNLGNFYVNALKEADFGNPVSAPKIDIVQLEADKPLLFKAEVEVKPEITIAAYDSLTVVRESAEIGDTEVDLQLQRMRERNAVISESEAPADENSILEADLQELDMGHVAIIGHKQEGVTIDLAKAAPEFRDPLIGIEVGQNRTVTIIKPPISPQDEKLHEHWQVTVKTVKQKQLPELDDDFARSMGDEIKDMKDFRERVQIELKKQVDAVAFHRMAHLLAHQVVDHSKLDVPQGMLKEYLDRIVEDARKSEHNVDNGKFDEEFVRSQFQDRAVWNLKWYLLREKISEQENLNVTDEDLEREYERIAQASGKNLKQIKAAYSLEDRADRMKDDMHEQKILQHLVSKAKVVEKKVSFEEFFAKTETEHAH
ncbi:trigger factor [bacterium]|nr:trigger factor [bacterium]